MNLIIGNILGFIGSILMVCLGFVHKRRYILIGQNIQFLIMGVGNAVLGGMSGLVANIVSVARNVFFLKREMTAFWKYFFVVVQILVSGVFLYVGGFRWMELLPIVSAVLYTVMLDTPKESHLKIVLTVCQLMWLTYDIMLMNYAAAVFDVLTICANFVGMMRAIKEEAMENKC
ncbi:YgjV family protein [Oribacterium sp. WCC10]|uniref:YgjV family protein n=1 Tax=Oribacterium sp. WCC10 TaxID=1855343 RepID=UPI0008DF7E2D|nr:YgjV family protein [Oribacterium sp. WCC10]SFG44350.1 inner membrane protein [Oribacterium sp. WCC10]